MYYGFIGSLLITGIAYVFKPDTSYGYPFPLATCLSMRCEYRQDYSCLDVIDTDNLVGYKHGL